MMWPRVHKVDLLVLFMCITLMLILPVESLPKHNDQNKRLFLGCNWKCAVETTDEVDELCDNLNRMWGSLSSEEKRKVELCVNPPYVYLDRVRRRLTREISLGSQNVFDALGVSVLRITSRSQLTPQPMLLIDLSFFSSFWCHSPTSATLAQQQPGCSYLWDVPPYY